MDDNVIDLAIVREEMNPTVTGGAQCMLCNREWEATVPAGTVWLECPSCGAHKGHFKYHTSPENGMRFECSCGNSLFTIQDNYEAMCPNCGVRHNLYDVE